MSKKAADYPIEFRRENMSISLEGDLLITGPPAEKVRRLLLNYPLFYKRYIVPFLKQREASFQPNECWIDPAGRVHLTNRQIVKRMRAHLPR